MKPICTVLLMLLIIIACKTKDICQNISSQPALSNKKINIKKHSQIEIKLPDDLIIDDETPVDYSVDDNTLYIFDQYKNRLLSYSFALKKIINKINVEKQLPLDYKVSGMTFYNRDTVALYDYNRRQLCLFNLDGVVFKTIKLSIPETEAPYSVWYPSPMVSNHAPVSFYHDTIRLIGMLPGERESEKFEGRYLVSSISLSDSTQHFSTPYTSVYKNRNYGGYYFRLPYSTINYSKGIELISLPASHDVIQFNLSNSGIKLLNLSPPFSINIPSIGLSKNTPVKETFTAEHYSTNYSYKNIIYHPYKDVYIRILEHPLPVANLNIYKLGYKNCTLLVYDTDFRFISQCSLDRFLSTDNYFISSDGIYFMKGDNHNEDVSQYVFYEIN